MPSEINTFFEGYSDHVSAISKALRQLILQAAPDCNETLHPGWKVVSYGYKKKFCAIAPHRNWVNLQFHSGASLLTNADLLIGSGKSMRHVKVAGRQDISDELSALVVEASTLAR